MSGVAGNIRKYRAQRALTQDGLAEKLHVTRQTVSNWETGKNQPDLDMLEALAEALEIDVSALFGGGKEAYPRFQRKALVWVAVLGFLALLLLADRLFLAPYLLELRKRTFRILPNFLNACVLEPILRVAAGMLIPAVVSLWRRVRVEGRLRLVLLLAFALLLLPALLASLSLCWPFAARFMVFLASGPAGFDLTLVDRVFPFLAGLCIYPVFAPSSERV